jgi:hypothetical protein
LHWWIIDQPLSGIADKANIISIYKQAIPKARQAGTSGQLANAFTSAMAEVVGVQGALFLSAGSKCRGQGGGGGSEGRSVP